MWLSQGLVALPRMGGQVNTAQACGRKDYKEAGFYAASALQMTILFGSYLLWQHRFSRSADRIFLIWQTLMPMLLPDLIC